MRRYVSLDGGMGDNIRPALYDARYEAVLANKVSDPPEETVTLVGKYCESGGHTDTRHNIASRRIRRPDRHPIVRGPTRLPMASNYNLNPRPAIVMVKDGDARLIRRRET